MLDALAAADLDVELVLSADADDLVALARRAFGRGRGGRRVRGGDGTVNALAGVAADEGGVLGILPLGSGNDFARQLDIPATTSTPPSTCSAPARSCSADLGRVHTADGATTWFTTVANTGFDAVANAWANTVTWTSGTPLYVLATLRTLAAYSPTPVRVTVDDATTIETEAWLVAVGNTRTYASGMMITPAASVHDGLLDVCVVGPVSRDRLPAHVPVGVQRHARRTPGGAHRARHHVVVEALAPRPRSTCGPAASTSARCPRGSNRSPARSRSSCRARRHAAT